MELYLKVAFWAGVARVVIYLLVLGGGKYPRTPTYNAGNDVVSMVVSALYAFWAGYLLFLK
ncbi:hypothetical protein GN109_05755 [Collimonas pratensis]|uniref:hypothetical protein n=1 Tax=Collimonas pratensis TaxID=279113 RepID=UPI00143D1304|nr:hypothetical protein [Collimonas pratensis]NKI68919.1 hypothetical protein [Collimonas pratensis]